MTAEVRPFFDDMAAALGQSHLVLARSGASILEVAACGRPSILVPYPYAADNHQWRNAQIFEAAGAARLITDADFDGRRCAAELRRCHTERGELLAMGQRALKLAKRDAAALIAAELQRLAGDGPAEAPHA
jgi:UDP-N-acetylglucosamine--N-acetylmuramyl-(pentapeptide) pyrophosphoryl-undecaprenol N-acetylglucosamine transferase